MTDTNDTARKRLASGSRHSKGCVVKGASDYRAEQGSHYAPGISAETVGSLALWLGIVTIPPGQRTKAHIHERHESAFYFLSGDEVELWTGDRLQHCEKARPGDYLFIPANIPHVAINLGSAPAVFVGARNEATAQESVIMRPELDSAVAHFADGRSGEKVDVPDARLNFGGN
jgi:uncharacterized RmlC-like cupin family protein